MTNPRRQLLPSSRQQRPGARIGFTLLELMISIALVLLLVLGINQVFSLTSRTVGAGLAISSITRDARAAQNVIYGDFRGALVDDAPFLFIQCDRTWGWRNVPDQREDRDGQVQTFDRDRDNVETGPTDTIGLYNYNFRNHRIDKIGFFSRGLFRRQTGNQSGNFVSNLTSPEAYVWYGHLRRMDNKRDPNQAWDPGADAPLSNPNNFYATDWILGRTAILMRDASTGMPNGENYWKAGSPTMSPLHENSGSNAGDGLRFKTSRYDLAGVSIDQYNNIVEKASAVPTWWRGVASFRFLGNPVPTRPLDSRGAALTVPVFLPGCTQFMVDFAGDFFTQDPLSGTVIALAPDGVVDFAVVNNARQVRWYGYPRDTNNDGKIIMADGDVVPARDVVGSTQALPFEREQSSEATFLKPVTDYSTSTQAGAQYTVAWGPDTRRSSPTPIGTPSMLRFTITLDDAGNRLADGQAFEYVVKLK